MELQLFDSAPQREVLSVSTLNTRAKSILESNIGMVWLEGEISNLARPASGHLYFSLKDSSAQIRCAWFKFSQKTRFALENGMQILVYAKVSLYAPRGDYQLIIERVEPVGEGKLQLQFEQLKKKLQASGLFDPKPKKPLPKLPQCIGVITSATGAALRDILSVLKRRCPGLPIIIYPTAVQGAQAAPAIVHAIELANTHQHCDVLLLARGGGSLEDLWPFNEEIVAHAIFKSTLPIVSGVGHEVDTTIADFVSDLRAPTPSAAAELASPDFTQLIQHVDDLIDKATKVLHKQLTHLMQTCHHLSKRLMSPQEKIYHWLQRLDHANVQLKQYTLNKLNTEQTRLNTLMQNLELLSPLSTLKRGYAIVKDEKQHIIRTSKDTRETQTLNIQLAKGNLDVTVNTLYLK